MTAVAITGAGIVTSLAQSPAELHESLCAGVSGLTPVGPFAPGLACELGAVVDSDLLKRALAGTPTATLDRVGQLTIVAAARALASSVAGDSGPTAPGLVLGTMFSGAHTIGEFDRRAQSMGPALASPLDFANTVLNAAAGQAAIRLSLRGMNATIAGGHASGLQALAYASDLVAAGRAEALVAGGAEELCVESYLGFCRAGLMCGTNGRPGHVPVPFEATRSGCALGEGAAFVVVEAADAAARRGAMIRATVAAHVSVNDPEALARGCCGRDVIVAAIEQALESAALTADDVDAISAAANGSYDGDAEEAAALAAVFGCRATPAPITAIKAALGEMLGASGPLQVIAMLEAMRDGRLPGIRGLRDAGVCRAAGDMRTTARAVRIRTALVTSVSPEGGCCVLVLRAGEEAH
jgi:3-oxoacyl-[acyl-carrier-protein] synthase II